MGEQTKGRIQLDENYYITTDSYNYILRGDFQVLNKKKSAVVTVEKVIGYYSHLEDALKGYLRRTEKDAAETFNGEIKEYTSLIIDSREKAKMQLVNDFKLLSRDN